MKKTKTNNHTTHKNNNTKSNKKQQEKQRKQQEKQRKQQEKQRKVIVNWHDYCIALSRRGDFLYFLNGAIKLGAFEKVSLTHERGRPTEYSDALITLILIYREIYHQPLRQVVQFTRLILLCQGITNAVPSYVTVCRRAKDLKIKILPPEYRLRAGDNICYCLDSSGFKVSGEGEWFRRKWGKQKARTFTESHVGINSNDRMILSVINTDCNVHDNTQLLPSLIAANYNLSEIDITQKLEAIVLDGAYDDHTNYTLANNFGARLITPPPVNATLHMHKDKDIGKFVDDVG